MEFLVVRLGPGDSAGGETVDEAEAEAVESNRLEL